MMTCFLLIAYLKMTYFLFILRIYNVIKLIVMACFFVNCIFENDMFLLFFTDS